MDTTKILEGIYSIQKTVELMNKRLTSVENKIQSVEIKMDLLHDDHKRFEEKQDFLQEQLDTFIRRTVDNTTDIRSIKRVLKN